MGCWGCGCLVVGVLAVLFLGLVTLIVGFVWMKAQAYTSPVAMTVPTFDGGDAMYNASEQKLTDFDHALTQHKPGKLELSGDEIDTLIARNPDFKANHIQLFLTLDDDVARTQVSAPTEFLSLGWMKGRFLNCDTTCGLDFTPDDKDVHLKFKSLRIADQDTTRERLPDVDKMADVYLNILLHNDDGIDRVLQQATSISIENGTLIIETK